jgi:signal transduction histidine kinase
MNGLNIILGNVDSLEAQLDDTDTSQLETIRNRGEELTRFTEATKASMENFLAPLDTSSRPINLSAALSEEVQKARKQYDTAEISVEVPDEIYIEGDDFVSELFSNLLSNAVVHNDKPTPKASVTARRSDGTVIVRVADNGPGIPDEEKDRVLEWNVKGADSPGTGLGLAIANTVAESYGGTLWIEDNDPGETVMNVELPLTSRTDPDAHRNEIQPS